MREITIDAIKLHLIAMPLVEPLRTSFGVDDVRAIILVEMQSGDLIGWGECVVSEDPGYSYETIGTALHIMQDFLIPKIVGQKITSAVDLRRLMKGVRGHLMAKAAIEGAVWDVVAQANGKVLADLVWEQFPLDAPRKKEVLVGVSIGIQPSIDETLAIIEKRVNEGYRRVKLKIAPGWDLELTDAVRSAYPDILLMLDANSAYTLDDIDRLARLDKYNLLMLEQPLAHDDIYEHSKLQARLETPVCLDESIHSANDVRLALAVKACKIINLKPHRVGGMLEACAVHKVCYDEGVPLWIGGMLETGIGRAQNLAIASLPGVTLPCDLSATNRYYDPDLADPPFVLNANSTVTVPDSVGTGVTMQLERLEEAKARFTREFPGLV